VFGAAQLAFLVNTRYMATMEWVLAYRMGCCFGLD